MHNPISKIKGNKFTALLIGIGFSTLFSQIFLIREASVWLRGNEFIVAVIIAAWLMWTAVGCAVSYYLSINKNFHLSTYYSWLASVIISACELILLKCFWACTGKLPGESLNLSYVSGLAVAITALPCFFSGLASGSAIELLKSFKKKSVAYFYFSESFGALIAGIIVTFIFIPLQHWWFSIAFLVSVPIIILFLYFRFQTLNFWFFFKILIIIIFFAGAWKYNDSFDTLAREISSRFLTGKIVLDIDAPRERFTVTTRDSESAFYINGRLTGSSVQRERAEEISWYSFLSARNPATALLIGFPYNGILREFVEKNIKVTVLDPEKKLINKYSEFLLPEDAKVIKSPHVKIIPEDCRTFLKTHNNKYYDLILQNIGIPESYALSRLYSTEWFKIISNHLASNGTITVVLPGSAGYVPYDLAKIFARAFKTMNSVFKFVTIIPGSSTLLIASNSEKVPNTPGFWLKKYKSSESNSSNIKNLNSVSRANKPVWFNSALINDNLNNFRIAQFKNACAQFKSISVHKDLSPFLYGDSLLYSEARFSGKTHKMLSAIYNNRSMVITFTFMFLFLWICAVYLSKILNFTKSHLWLLMTTFSAAGFIAEMSLLVRFMIELGSLFYFIGLLFAGFMLGLSTATYTIEKTKKIHRLLLPASIIMLCVSLYAITFLPMPSQPFKVILLSLLLNIISGLCVGNCFAILARKNQTIELSGLVLYSADLCGALIGCLLFSIIIPPVLGFGFLTVIVTGTLILVLLI